MQKTTLARIVIGPIGARGRRGRRRSDCVHCGAGRPTVRRQWDEWIVAGAFSRRLDAAGLSAEVTV
jgi:hypothetical protein